MDKKADVNMAVYAQVVWKLVQVHRDLKKVQQMEEPVGCVGEVEGGEKSPILSGSTFYYAAYFMGVDPSHVYCVLAIALRGVTEGMPAHSH